MYPKVLSIVAGVAVLMFVAAACVPVPPPDSDTDGDGVADSTDNCLSAANSDQSDRYGSAKGDACEDDSNGDGILDIDETDICVWIDGVEVIRVGGAICVATNVPGRPSIAIAHGSGADARANGGRGVLNDDSGVTAIAEGTDSEAIATGGCSASAGNGFDGQTITCDS